MSGNEEEEFRKMAEIADAINDILRADDDLPSGADDPSLDTREENSEDNHAGANGVISNFADAVSPTDTLPEDTDTDTDTTADKGLEAAIAAELAHDAPIENESSQTEDPQSESADRALDNTDLAILSLRMRDTLAELKNEHGDNLEATEALISRMQGSRDILLEELDAIFQSLEKKIAARKSVINQEIDRIYQEIATTRSEMELMAARFQQNTTEAHENYNEIFLEERKRVERYREFLTFMLRERK